MTEVFVVIVLAVGLGFAVRAFGFAKCALMLMLVCTALVPRNLTSTSLSKHVGIAPSNPELTTYAVVLAGFLLFAVFRPQHGYRLWLWIPLLLWLTLGTILIWSGGPTVEAGVLQLILAPAGWVLGVNISGQVSSDGGRFLVRTVFLIIFVQLLVCGLQVLGLNVNAMDASQEAILGLRYNGTLGHPNDLGKIIFLLVALILPFGRKLERFDLAIWRMAIAAALVVLGLTGGRAVSAATVCMLLLWSVLSPSREGTKGRKALTVGIALTAAVFLAGVLLGRFDEDPEGGARTTLTDIAWAQIMSSPWAGVGPNLYVDVVGSYNPLTASGVPVHNAFLLALAEIGVVGALALLLPIVACLIRVLPRTRLRSFSGEASRVYVCALPGLYLIGTTGWGVLGGYVLPLLAMVFAVVYSWSAQPEVEELSQLEFAQR
ncbi:hypothetical protein QFZ23_003813 [Arthrobacter globiformis]|uniref:O-antigen ligase family protein n=1 Tax=Arthrobacter globiformis TaxID=1665 RepID=UPI002789FAB4|nr:O-antigen ligase family protein [Arthrobacter globiformis]MDQ1059912.1 hypothetical protein [Arthrobacter globiformis]